MLCLLHYRLIPVSQHNKPVAVSQGFNKLITNSFSSFESLRQTMIATADTMFGPGFVWLVLHKNSTHDSSPQLKLLNTYLAGSPYVGAHWRKQAVDMSTTDNLLRPGETAQHYAERTEQITPAYGFQNSGLPNATKSETFQSRSKGPAVPGSAIIEPLLCVNTWPHVYLEQFGVAGKREYLETWWESINWQLVWSQCERVYDFRR